MNGTDVLKRDKVSREAHARVVAENQRLLGDLAQARETIRRLQLQRAQSIHTSEIEPLEPKSVIGIVKCPRCGQYMEVEK